MFRAFFKEFNGFFLHFDTFSIWKNYNDFYLKTKHP
jgi:hypothetical protein